MLDDDGELIFPAEFIDTAERFDLIGSIDRWVLRNVKALVGIAHGLGTTTVAEFVGDDATLHPPPPPRLASATA
jgi:EAL domain-containing protein (putative c-di-GMP-specific phosphodiesterase class I)